MATEAELAQALSPAFGVYPKAFRGNYGNPEDAANLPVDVLRGRTAGLLGMFGDVVNQPIAFPPARAAQLAIQGLSGQEQYKYPDTEHFLKTMPLAPTSRAGQVAGQAASYVPLNPAPAVRAVGAAGRALGPTAANMAEQYMVKTGGILPLDVYQGTPHTFPPTERNPLGEFDASKIGTGEGAQAYGHGIYTAENPEVAKGYQKSLAYKTFDLSPEAEKLGLKLNAGARGEFIRQAAVNKSPEAKAKSLQNANIAARDLPQEKLAELFKTYDERGGGNLYKANLPDEKIAKMLDWDKPFSEQQPDVKAALAKYDPETYKPSGADYDPTERGQWTYMRLANATTQKNASNKLKELGIPGIKYFDEGSRDPTKAQTRNFVIFPGEEKNLTILERNK